MRRLPFTLLLSLATLSIGCATAADSPGGQSPAADLSAAPSCGDGKCDPGEDCSSCAVDCGACPICAFAPACTASMDEPTQLTPRADLNSPKPGAGPDAGSGAATCKSPQVRIRVQKIKVNQGGGQIYCVVNASDGIASEAALSPKTPSLAAGKEYAFDAGTMIFWGTRARHATTNNLTVTYNCFLVVGDDWSKALNAAGDLAAQLGGMAGQNGWAFGAADVAAKTAAAALAAAAGDNLNFNAQQTVPRDALLDLTNGRTWTVEGGQRGTDWTLTLEAWGCAEGKK